MPSTVKYLEGDIVPLFKKAIVEDEFLKQKFVLIHFTNCCCNLETGVTRKIIEAWPAVQDADWGTKPKDHSKLGSYSFVKAYFNNRKHTIVTCYSQFGFHYDNNRTDYNALEKSLLKAKAEFCNGATIYMTLPYGEEAIIKKIIQSIFEGSDVTVINRKQLSEKKKNYLSTLAQG